jgi:hypothetical protein
MRATTLARAASVATAAMIAAGGAMATAGAASAAPAAPKLATHLIVAKRKAVEHHKKVTVIASDLRSHKSGLVGKVVYLDRKVPGGKWTQVAKEVTGKRGGAVFVVNPAVTARFVVVFKGTANFAPSHSRVVTVVKAKA